MSEVNKIKVAFVTDDGNTICQHFGRAKYYEVVTIENGNIINRERREKVGHHTFYGNEHHEEKHGHGHGFDDHSRHKHNKMTENILDCQMLVARGMGNGAYQHLQNANIKPVITSNKTIDEAVKEIIAGTIINYTDKLH